MPRILIADRDEPIAVLLRTALCRVITDCDVMQAHDPEAAAAALQSGTFDLVLLDIGMYSDGLETLRHINAQSEVIAFTTGVIQAPLVQTLAEADVYAVVTKPFDLSQVTEIIVESLRRGRVAEPNSPLVYREGGNPERE